MTTPTLKRLKSVVQISRNMLSDISCPKCGAKERTLLLKYDRYLIPSEISICSNCALVYTARNLTGKDLQQFYQSSYRHFYESVLTPDSDYIYETRDRLKASYRYNEIDKLFGKPKAVLEIGSGLGYFLQQCKQGGSKNVLGLELGQAFKSYTQKHLGLTENVTDTPYEEITSLDFQPSTVAMFHVLEHLENPVECLTWVRKIIEEEGILVIEVPDIHALSSQVGLNNFHFGHRTYFCAETLQAMLSETGFTPIFVCRSNDDGIYPGNLRVYAKAEENKHPTPHTRELTERSQEYISKFIDTHVKYFNLTHGYLRAAARLLR